MNQNENLDQTEVTETESQRDEAILELAKKRFQEADEAWADILKAAEDDLRFANGEQWPEDVKRAREIEGRPCLTINRLPQFIRQITNDQRQNRPSIKVSPVDDHADIETARVQQGIIRHIEYASNADTAYDTGFDSGVRAGFGFWRVVTEYSDPMSFEQDIRIKRIADRFSVRLDPNFSEPDGSDANWGTVFTNMSPEEFKATYPNATLSQMTDWEGVTKSSGEWVKKDSVRIAEYFYKEFTETEIVLISDGKLSKVVEKAQLPKPPAVLPEGISILDERKTIIPKIKWCKHNGIEILEKTDWPGQWIPIVPVLGEEQIIDGKRVLSGAIRHAKDSQRMYNYWKSTETETIALAPKAPYVGYAGQFEGHEVKWNAANRVNYPYLEANPVTDASGQTLLPLPQRNISEPPVQAITNASLYAADDMKATTGIYDAALGAKSNENSGVAIQRRNIQSQTSNFHFIDNLSKSIRHTGRIILDLIPYIYDTPRAARILGEDGTEEIVKLNQEIDYKGEKRTFSFGVGKYDVTVDTGPSFETKRQEAVASMLDFIKAMPQQAASIADLVVANMDWPGAQEIKERLKKVLPPELQDQSENQKPLPPQVQAQMSQMDQMIAGLTEKLNAAQDQLEQKTLELESKERIEFAKLENQSAMKLAELESKEAITILTHQMAELSQRLSLIGINQPIEQEFSGEQMPDQQMPPDQQQPTGGFPPGTSMGV